MNGRWGGELRIAPTTANPAACGRIVPARTFQAAVSMSVVANCDPLFQLWKSWTVPDADSRKMAETMDPRGLYPSAASSAAFSPQKAASTGVNSATPTLQAKPLNVNCKLVSTDI